MRSSISKEIELRFLLLFLVDNISTRGNDLKLLTIAPEMSLLCLIVAIKLLVVDEKFLCESAARWSAHKRSSNVNNKRTLQIN